MPKVWALSSNICGFGSLCHILPSLDPCWLREYDLGIYPKTGWFLMWTMTEPFQTLGLDTSQSSWMFNRTVYIPPFLHHFYTISGRINPAFTGFPQIVPEAPSAAAHCVDIPSKGYGCTATPGRLIDSHCHSMIIIINISISLMMTCNSFSVSPSFSLLLWLSFIHWVMKPTQKMWAELRARHPKTWTFAMFDGIQISILWSQ